MEEFPRRLSSGGFRSFQLAYLAGYSTPFSISGVHPDCKTRMDVNATDGLARDIGTSLHTCEAPLSFL
jgi:hypothetical protein